MGRLRREEDEHKNCKQFFLRLPRRGQPEGKKIMGFGSGTGHSGVYPYPFVGESELTGGIKKQIQDLKKFAKENAIKSIDELKPTLICSWDNNSKAREYFDKEYGTKLRTKDAIYYFGQFPDGEDIVIKLELGK